MFETKSLRLGLKIFFYQLVLSTDPAAANCPTGNLYVTSRGIFTPSYTENVLIKVVVQQKDILGVICIKYISFSWSNPYMSRNENISLILQTLKSLKHGFYII